MESLSYFRRQFLLTTHDDFDLPWEKIKILNFNLFYHPALEYEHVSNGKYDLYLLGFLFDYEHPEYSNKKIIAELSDMNSFNEILEKLSKYSGHFVMIYKTAESLSLLNDACAQHEVYYDTSFSTFGTQVKLLSKVIPLLPHSSTEANEFYSSGVFSESRLFIGETTHHGNIRHLLPNHFIDVRNKSIHRFFPAVPFNSISIQEATDEVIKMLKGYIKAASLRYKLSMGVTGGYDSRILFLTSMDVDCKYYVTQLPDMSSEHTDLVISKLVTDAHNRNLRIIKETNEPGDNQILEASIDFTRYPTRPGKEYENSMVVNGNISEISRHRFCYYKTISPADLAFLYGYRDNPFVINEFGKWIKTNYESFNKMGYRMLDMFYWEEKMAKWAAKGKTEMSALGTIVYSPFCSHKLLITLLSTPRKHRDFIDNMLYDSIIFKLSPAAAKIPVNPSTKKNIIRLMKKIKLFGLYRFFGLKYRLMGTYSW